MSKTLHVVGLPHTQPTDEFSWCAYTMKHKRFVQMMRSLGYTVHEYLGDPVWTSDSDHIPAFGPEEPLFLAHAATAVPELLDRAEVGDYLCLIAGRAQQPIAAAVPELVTVEYGIGYEGTFADYRVFESNAWMHTVYGQQQGAHAADGRFYDAVIPNSFDLSEFPEGTGAGGYLLYIGRNIERKGVGVAEQVAERAGLPLRKVGPGFPEVVGPAERAELMGGAVATLVPTLYVEPFGGVAVESMLCGTPVITTDFGAFTETVVQGETGWRCHDLGEFVWAAKHAGELSRPRVRQYAQGRYDMEVVKHSYDDYFARLSLLQGDGWFTDFERPPVGGALCHS